MGGKKGGESTKKAAGNAKKAEVAAQKKAVADAQKEREESAKWSQGAKDSSKKEAAAIKAEAAAAKKAERDALLAAEESNQPSKPKSAGAKKAEKKASAAPSRGTLNLSKLDASEGNGNESITNALNATGIDSALDALSLTTSGNDMKIDRHPERRFKAAYAAFEARRLPEIEQENPGLRRQQRVELCRKEFEKSDENPFNSGLTGKYDMTKEAAAAVRDKERTRMEKNLS